MNRSVNINIYHFPQFLIVALAGQSLPPPGMGMGRVLGRPLPGLPRRQARSVHFPSSTSCSFPFPWAALFFVVDVVAGRMGKVFSPQVRACKRVLYPPTVDKQQPPAAPTPRGESHFPNAIFVDFIYFHLTFPQLANTATHWP